MLPYIRSQLRVWHEGNQLTYRLWQYTGGYAKSLRHLSQILARWHGIDWQPLEDLIGWMEKYLFLRDYMYIHPTRADRWRADMIVSPNSFCEVSFKEDVFEIYARNGIGVRIFALERRGTRMDALGITCAFVNRRDRTEFMEQMDRHLSESLTLHPSREGSLLIRSLYPNHWIFNKRGGELLGDRLVETDQVPNNNRPTYRISPLEGEKVCVYQGRAADQVGLSNDTSMPTHPDRAVFASVGPISLALKWGGETHRGKGLARDRIVAFHDKRLPSRAGNLDPRIYDLMIL